MSRGDTAGRGPRSKRSAASRDQRPRAPLPKRMSPRVEAPVHQGTTFTARAAILAVAVASVIVAIALPFKIWLGQRNDIGSLARQNQQIQQHVSDLTRQDQLWNTPGYIESQAKKRLHYVLPGQKSYVVLGKPGRTSHRGAKATSILASGPWYSQLWSSMQVAGGVTASKK